MPLQFIDINNSTVTFANEEKDPASKQQAVDAQLAMQLAQANMKLVAQEQLTATLALELAQLKTKGEI